MEKNDRKKILHLLSECITHTEEAELGALLRAFDASLNLLNSRAALSRAAQWFLENRTADGTADPDHDFWASRVTRNGAIELGELIPRLVMLYAEHRQCDLAGNSGAMWAYSEMAILHEPPDASLQEDLLDQLFKDVTELKRPYDFRPVQICHRAFKRAPKNALCVRFEHECPDTRLGHFMMRLEIGSSEAVLYWPQIDDAEYNFVDLELLSETCDMLGLRSVLPIQLACFLSVIGYATVDHTESWGGRKGMWFFEEGNIPFTLKHLERD